MRKSLFDTIEEASDNLKPVINEMIFKIKTASDEDGSNLTWQEVEEIVLDFFEASYKKAFEKMKNNTKD